MLRPNYAMDEPPSSIEVGGSSYPVDTDYRTWLQILGLTRKLNFNAKTDRGLRQTFETLLDMQELAFGGVLKDEAAAEVLEGMTRFLAGYPSAPHGSLPAQDAPVMSFDYDLNEILIAIRVQYGIDLSWRRREPFHWWEFQLLVNCLAGESYLSALRDIRGYKGTDKERQRLKYAYALPVELTAAEQEEWDAFSAQFEPKEDA